MTISTSTFQFVTELVRRETAMLYEPGKEYLIEARLLPLARAAGTRDVEGYVAHARRDPAEQAKIVDALTINETSWFRDKEPFYAFAETMLPGLIEKRHHTRRLSIWSAACSSGQEAYSLAMLLREYLPAGWTVDLLATDVSKTMIGRVQAGRYSQVEMNRGMPATSLVENFARVGAEWEISSELRKMVRTDHLNLAAPFPELPAFDVVFLRNVLIYFDMATKREVLTKVRSVVRPDGYLVLGTSETTLDMDDQWEREAIGRVLVSRPTVPSRMPDKVQPAGLASRFRGRGTAPVALKGA